MPHNDPSIQAHINNINPGDELPAIIARFACAYAQEMIADAARDVLNFAREYPFSTKDHLTEYVNERTSANSNEMIYTWNARCYLMGSNNHGAYADEIGEPAPSVEAAASLAYARDVFETPEYRQALAIIKARA